MPTHVVMTRKDGDLKHDFRVDDEAEVAKAMQRFQQLTKSEGYWAAEPGQNGQPGRVVREFDPAVSLIFMKQLQGG